MAIDTSFYGVPFQNLRPILFTVEALAIAQSGSITKTLQINTDAEFILTQILGLSSQDDASGFNNNFKVLISNQSVSNYNFSNTYIPQALIASNIFNFNGEARLIRFAASTIFQFDIQNLYAGSLDVNLVLKGYNYYAPAS